jgi:two-component system nitrogen regulation response regulator NtrX
MAHEILIVDDEADIRSLTAAILQDEGYETRVAANSTEALAAIEARPPGLVLLDIWLQGSQLDGLQILRHVRRNHPSLPVLMMSGHGTIETAVAAIKDGAYDFIEKPFTADRMILLIVRAIEAAKLRRENEELRLRVGGDTLIGRSAQVQQLRNAIERVSRTNSRVLVSGPQGAGKEVVARMIHALSHRADGPFVALNCVNMRPERLDEELFGIEGSDGTELKRKLGVFERAHNGTLLLDEVADMPLETQARIVRLLQEQTFERVGGVRRVEVDVRVVAATSRDLTELMRQGKFREDLFYRLSVVPVQVPPLRIRREDIPLLAGHFMEHISKVTGQPRRTLGEDAIAALQSYPWPGNVRELRNVIERLLIMVPANDAPIGADLLPAEILGNGPEGLLQWRESSEIMGLPLRDAREAFEREYLLAQITRFDGNISRTAEFVGMERSALHRKLKSLGVQEPERRRRLDAL